MGSKTGKSVKQAAKARAKKAPPHKAPLDIVTGEAFDNGRLVATRTVRDPLDRMRTYRQVSKRQFMAGEKLREDYLLGVEGARDGDGHGSGGSCTGLADAQLFAITAFKDAVRHLGQQRAAILVPVVCGGIDLRSLAPRIKLDRIRIAALFGAALDDLADHYRISRGEASERDLAAQVLAAYLPQDLRHEMLDCVDP